MKTKTPLLATRFFASVCAAGLMVCNVLADTVNTMKEALDVALKQDTIAAAGDKAKLYSISANYKENDKRWTFSFYDGGDNVHTVSVKGDGKTHYSAREKGSLRIFDDLDFSKLPAPQELIIDDAIDSAKSALTGLGFEVIDNGKVSLYYNIMSEYRQKDKPAHNWRVTLPVKDEDPKKAKSVNFLNGKIDTISNTSMY